MDGPQAALNSLLSSRDEQRTSVIIAHRLSTIRGADSIVVLEKVRVGCTPVLAGKSLIIFSQISIDYMQNCLARG